MPSGRVGFSATVESEVREIEVVEAVTGISRSDKQIILKTLVD